MGWASSSYADMHAQLAALVYPGFLRATPEDILPELQRYLRALAQRTERVRLDPQRDQARLLELTPFLDALAAANDPVSARTRVRRRFAVRAEDRGCRF